MQLIQVQDLVGMNKFKVQVQIHELTLMLEDRRQGRFRYTMSSVL